MIIDLILDRRANENDIARGLTHYSTYNNPSRKRLGQIELNDGSVLLPLAYNAKDFYNELQDYGEIFGDLAWNIARAMDEGNEEDVKRELCNYVITQGYSENICDYINSVEWLKSQKTIFPLKKGKQIICYISYESTQIRVCTGKPSDATCLSWSYPNTEEGLTQAEETAKEYFENGCIPIWA